VSHPAANLLSIGTAVPPHILTQEEIAERTRRVFGLRMPEYERIAPVFETAGIVKRHAVRPGAWYEDEHSWSDRTEVYLEAAADLFVAAAQKALDRAGLEGADIDTVITVSSTGIATPSLESRVAHRLGFGPRVARVPVFGLGCAGGVTGLGIASRLAVSRPGTNVLMVAVELCTLAVRLDQMTKANIVALALFGDGAAAAVVTSGDGGLASLGASGEHMWPGTRDIMGWSVDPQGFGVIFDRSIPPFAEEHLAPAIRAILGSTNTERSHIDRYVCHPGGRKVIEAIESALGLESETLDHERAVLAHYGNMSAPTALFVLDRVIERGLPSRCLTMALGPGFTVSTIGVERPRA
jgi:alkylresorcinol/alkylpyrone synthase